MYGNYKWIFIAVVIITFVFGLNKGKNHKSILGQKNHLDLYTPPSQTNQSPFTNRLKSNNLRINGVPVKMQFYLSNKTIEHELNHFTHKWASKGFEVKQNSFHNLKMVNILDENRAFFKCILLIPQSDSKTIIIPAEMDISKPIAKYHSDLPIYPNAQTLFHIESNDYGKNSKNIIFTSHAPVSVISNYYKQLLPERGWQLVSSGEKKFQAPNQKSELYVNKIEKSEMWLHLEYSDENGSTMAYILQNKT